MTNSLSEQHRTFPVTHSLLAASALARDVLPAYDLGDVTACTLLAHNLNDTYLVHSADATYILRVYQAQRATGKTWRSLDEIRYELDLLRHLDRHGIPVARPLATRAGALTTALDAPEGIRHAALFTYAPGTPLSPPRQTPDLSEEYGRAVARLHTAADNFTSPHARFALDRAFLIETPMRVLEPLLAHRPDDWRYLVDLGARIGGVLDALPREGIAMGACHGDVQGGNAHRADDGTITFFDFDLCGPGPRVYDIAVFHWGAALGSVRLGWDAATVRRLCDAYLNGYTALRPLADADLRAIAPLVVARELWYLGAEAGNWDNWGTGLGSDAFFDRELAFLRSWQREHLDTHR